jgi:serine O-acetyltransferase
MPTEKFIEQLFDDNKKIFEHFPDKVLAQNFADELYHLLFAPHRGKYETTEDLQKQFISLKAKLKNLFSYSLIGEQEINKHADFFFEALPSIYKELMEDASAVLDSDPSAQSIEEVLLAYPGFYSIAVYRIAHHIHLQNIKLLPRIFTEHAHSQTGIDIHPGAVIGKSFFIDHGTGIVIGETAIIGNNVKIYQGVTLGALNVSKAYTSIKRHPTIQDNVVIYSGATILGGDTVIGSNSIIGGNVWLTYSVPEHSVVYHQSEIKIRDNNPFPEPLNFVI